MLLIKPVVICAHLSKYFRAILMDILHAVLLQGLPLFLADFWVMHYTTSPAYNM